MEFLNPLLSRLFRSRQQGEAGAEEVLAEQVPTQDSLPDAAPDPGELILPQDHAISQLWRLRMEQTDWLPAPLLRLAAPEQLLPLSEIRKELVRLQLLVNTSANERLKLAKPPKPAPAAGEDPEQPKPEEEPSPDLDAEAVVFTSLNALAAWVLVYPPVGQGEEIDRDTLSQALEEKQISYGVDEAMLDALPQDPDRYFHLFLVAQGQPAIQGVDGRVVDMFARHLERTVTLDENNRVDYTSLNFIQNVEEGGLICRIIPPTEGSPGRTVTDQEIDARDGKSVTMSPGRNTALSEDGGRLIATRTGHVEFNGRSFQVKPLLEIGGNVDYSTGNINFLGDVCIHGDICSGFTVRAMGSITVDGVVEASTVEAGGDLVVVKGVQGDGQAVLRADRSLFSKYLENCSVYVKETLQTDCIINCDVYCDGGVTVRSGRMTIMGGTIRAAHEVSAGIIGSRSELPTAIRLGGNPCEEFDYDLLTQEIAQLEEEMEKIERRPNSPNKLSRMGKMRMQLSVNRAKLDQLQKQRLALEEEAEESGPGIRRMLADTVYGNTSLTIGMVYYHFDREIRPCIASLVGGEICLT